VNRVVIAVQLKTAQLYNSAVCVCVVTVVEIGETARLKVWSSFGY